MNPFLLVALSLSIAFVSIVFIHTIKRKFPKHYFSLGQIIVDEKEDITFTGLLVKFFPPLVSGLIVGILDINSKLEIAILSSFFSSFLVIWPVILSKYELLSPQALRQVRILYVIYVLYITQYVVIAVFGLFIGSTLRSLNISTVLTKFLNAYVDWHPLVQNIVGGVFGSIIFVILLLLLTKLYKKLFKRLHRRIRQDKERAYSAKL